jgi:signal transduction histidine kinase
MRVVSHEFRTPLAIIRNTVDMIDFVGHRTRADTRERIVRIREAFDRLFSVIDRFMSKDRESRFRPELIRPGSLIEDVRLHFEMTGQGERLCCTVGDNWGCLFVDPGMLTTIIINLVDNALKYSSEDEPVHVSVGEEGNCMVLRVSDRGIGIPPADLHRIGQRFYRGSNTSAGSGTGLGLYTSRKLLAYHNGKLRLLPNSDCGITAVVRLPLLTEMAIPFAKNRVTA